MTIADKILGCSWRMECVNRGKSKCSVCVDLSLFKALLEPQRFTLESLGKSF
jgi:hypothetical protein